MPITNLRIIEALRDSAWTPERQVDISVWTNDAGLSKYAWSEFALAVLKSLGGMIIAPKPTDASVYCPAPVIFDPLPLRYGGMNTKWEAKLKTTLSPLGECFECASMFIDERGRLYSHWDVYFDCLGVDFEDSLSTLLFAEKRMVERLYPRDVPPEEVLRYHARRLNGRSWRWPFLGPSYHMFADALYWADEAPPWWRLPELEDALRCLWHHRTGLLLGEKREWGELWELGKRLFPRWVGFHPSRCQPSKRDLLIYRAGRRASARCLAELEKEIAMTGKDLGKR